MRDKPVYVTRPYLPPLEEFLPYLEQIWENRILTNNGPFHQQFEQALCEHLGVEHIALVTNGTVALIIALQALGIKGEVITTPYSFAATSHSLVWNNIKPVFVDIDPNTCNLDPNRIEAAITPETTAIMPMHCYGNPCDVDRIQEIADAHDLRVIYDAAHAFGVTLNGESLLRHGDFSTLSFHATKVFNTFEGGAIVCRDAHAKQQIDYLKNFGFANEVTVVAPGINGKMSEINSAFGLVQLNHVESALQRRREIEDAYRQGLSQVAHVTLLPSLPATESNAAYFPIFVGEGYPLSRDALYEYLKSKGINGRRYFYPLISDMPVYRDLESAKPENLPVARQVAESVICLPIYPDLPLEQVREIIGLIRNA